MKCGASGSNLAKQVIAELKKLGYKTAALALTDDSSRIDDSN